MNECFRKIQRNGVSGIKKYSLRKKVPLPFQSYSPELGLNSYFIDGKAVLTQECVLFFPYNLGELLIDEQQSIVSEQLKHEREHVHDDPVLL